MFTKVLIWVLLTMSIVGDITSAPVQFPGENVEERSIDSYGPSDDAQPKFHHGLLQKHKKKKKRKRKKLGCRISIKNRYRNAGEPDEPEGRFFFYPLINYYDTDINIFNDIPVGKPGIFGGAGSGGVIDPCSSLIGAGAGAISGIGSIIGAAGVKPPPSVITGGTQPVSPAGGDNTDEDYDYSDGGDSDNNNNNTPGQGLGAGSNLLSAGASTLGSAISNAPGAVSNVLTSISNGIRPFLQGPNRYFDYYVVRPFNRSLSQLVSWI